MQRTRRRQARARATIHLEDKDCPQGTVLSSCFSGSRTSMHLRRTMDRTQEKRGHRLSACETPSLLLNETRETPHLLRPARVGIKSAVGSLDFLRVSPLGPFRRGLLLWPGNVSKKTCQLTSATSCDSRRKVPDVGWCQRLDDGLGTSKFSFLRTPGKAWSQDDLLRRGCSRRKVHGNTHVQLGGCRRARKTEFDGLSRRTSTAVVPHDMPMPL